MKIIGFKSFVEPTILHFKSNRTAIVGPNGCGKSNVIDAIRWVMGESSPRYLRGDMMSDVIFNGSLNRKGMSMASVEIILDNSNHYFQGAYIRKGDVALRREITRSGESLYFINNQKVRRKDLTDLWLGTGAGARGYAIIGQNMVNQLVEAHPEALKGYLEEAAGVSKYKERRKESMDRLQDISENLFRIADIIQELAQSLERLEKEAKDAQVFQNLRQNYRIQKEQIEILHAKKMIEKQELLCDLVEKQLKLEEQIQQECQNLEEALDDFEKKYAIAQEDVKQIDQSIYKKTLELQQIHERLALRKKDNERYVKEQVQLNAEVIEYQKQLKQLKEEQIQLNTQLENLQFQESVILKDFSLYQNQIHQIRSQLKEAYSKKNLSKQKIQEYDTQRQLLKLKIEQGLQDLAQAKDLMHTLKTQLDTNALNHLQETISSLEQQLEGPIISHLQLNESLKNAKMKEAEEFKILNDYQNQWIQTQAEFDELKRDMLNKEALYHGAMTSQQSDSALPSSEWQNISEWLKTWKIPQPWQKVVDFLWSQFLPQYYLQDFQEGQFFNPLPRNYYACMQIKKPHSHLASIIDMMELKSIPSGFFAWHKIYLSESFSQAKKEIAQLEEDESILCLDGIWLGKNWINYLPLHDDKQKGLATRLLDWQSTIAKFESFQTHYQVAQDQLNLAKANYQTIKTEVENKNQELENIQILLTKQKNQLEDYKQQYQYLFREQERCRKDLEKAESQYGQCLEKNQILQQEITENEQKLENLKQEGTQIQVMIDELQIQFQHVEKTQAQLQAQLQEKKLLLTKVQTQKSYIDNAVPQLQERSRHAHVRLQELEVLLNTLHQEDLYPEARLETLNHQLLEAQKKSIEANHYLEKMKPQGLIWIEKLEQAKKQHLQVMEKRWKLSSEKDQNSKNLTEVPLKYQNLTEADWKKFNLVQDEKSLKKSIQEIENQMQILGDVNLLAVGLYQQEQERLEHLRLQENDLKQAILELQHAVKTLDEDMQKRLHETLLAINHHLTEIFPQLFGGGQAKFVASCDNLLEATVAVEVQAPGKKQHRIQLLSGGEKALTAVALLFSIFSLNPAPFCLLDEVDAALDDANAQRLGSLIQKLSNTVQFVLITHNPLTMDVADELIGVTMQEPGVSRVVSVNMAMALEMVNKE